MFLLSSCDGRGNGAAAINDSTTLQIEAVQAVPKTFDEIIELIKTKNESSSSTYKIREKNDKSEIAVIEQITSGAEISGMTTYYISVWRGQNGKDFVSVFSLGCAEGSCNYDMGNFKVYDLSLNDITSQAIDMTAAQKAFTAAIPESEKMGFKNYTAFMSEVVAVEDKEKELRFLQANPDEYPQTSLRIVERYQFDAAKSRFKVIPPDPESPY
ncbi:MAG: hypothetical protein EAZ57_10440 [Cytophagales bacterium]|nr:MAG: hypothetical protein EAZ67_06935 [Cytophagales bacterium]TAF59657.1 MAG: hypothetical protein EAZ57_10440 [Cytophagales bacterium]